ncbi:hypothetical protein EDS67_25470 [candidate division KSB1 bacterium]|nr:MAG: hypothetical protein EDS67_25470 [candidate division KSB1 bacterium]MBC6947427.1 hypothetical protein [candidate division KSB1 bacterium]MCE7945199.1 hypothetical protein [Chlorobi bacterium CHB1]MDL1874217.1 hypothetical protein [Cytophagia bacterium CHB2]
MNINRLAFFDIIALEDDKVFRAGILLTKPDTVPLEFHLTDCVRPTTAQKILYGAIFERHLKVEVFGKPLLEALTEKPDAVITKELEIFQYVEGALDYPVVLISSKNDIQSISENHNGYIAELKKISQKQNLFEPFERIQKVILQVHSRELNQQSVKDTTKPPQSS